MTAFLVIVILLLIILIFNISSKKNKEIIELKAKNQESNSTIQQLNDSNNKLNFEISDLLGKVNSLSKYQGLVDLEKKANEIIAEADIYKQKILDEEVNIISQAKETLSSAKNQANVILLQAQTKLDSSVNESAKIIQNAEIKATEIAGSAYEAMKNANEYEKTVIAMKNIIKGYGDEYLKPTFSLLDDLSEEFGHTDAGQNLKTARERNNSLVRTNLAATCN